MALPFQVSRVFSLPSFLLPRQQPLGWQVGGVSVGDDESRGGEETCTEHIAGSGPATLGPLKVLPRSFSLGGYADDDSQVFL